MAIVVSRPKHKPTPETRESVRALAKFGIRQDKIAAHLNLDPKTLRLHYGDDLDRAVVESNQQVANALFKAATEDGSVAAMIFWLKIRAGWTERLDVNTNAPAPVTVILPPMPPGGPMLNAAAETPDAT